jgi:5'-3' exonuclease
LEITIDMRNVDKMLFDFVLGTPFRPFEQLMGVLPAASMEQIPMAYRVRQFFEKYLVLTNRVRT